MRKLVLTITIVGKAHDHLTAAIANASWRELKQLALTAERRQLRAELQWAGD